MQITVVMERIESNGFRARCSEPFALAAEGVTAEEALGKLRELVVSRVAAGDIVSLDVPVKDHAWPRMAGIWKKDDPLVEEWKQIMEENRREADADPDYL